jgi:hypothetical protein
MSNEFFSPHYKPDRSRVIDRTWYDIKSGSIGIIHLSLLSLCALERPLRLVESMRGIIPGTSQLDPDVLVSPHPAPDVLGLRLCSCVDNRGSFREPLRGY